MQKKTTILTLASASLAASLLLAGCSSTPVETPAPDSTSAPSSDVSTEANTADEMFAMMMIEHHQQAVEMSDIILAKDDVASDVADLAQRIKDAQGPEIDRMNSWLEAWGASDMSGMDHGASMDGMLSEEDLQALEAADGPTASKLFLQQMIEHHEGAVKMAETQLSEGKNPDALELAQQIIDAQTMEIQEMRDLLDTL